jgi:hypothetical protein
VIRRMRKDESGHPVEATPPVAAAAAQPETGLHDDPTKVAANT